MDINDAATELGLRPVRERGRKVPRGYQGTYYLAPAEYAEMRALCAKFDLSRNGLIRALVRVKASEEFPGGVTEGSPEPRLR